MLQSELHEYLRLLMFSNIFSSEYYEVKRMRVLKCQVFPVWNRRSQLCHFNNSTFDLTFTNLNITIRTSSLFRKWNSGFFPSCIFSRVKGNCVLPCFSLRRGRRYTSPEYIVPSFMIMFVLVIYFSIWAYKIFKLFRLSGQNPKSYFLINRLLIVLYTLFVPFISHFCSIWSFCPYQVIKLHFPIQISAPDSVTLLIQPLNHFPELGIPHEYDFVLWNSG